MNMMENRPLSDGADFLPTESARESAAEPQAAREDGLPDAPSGIPFPADEAEDGSLRERPREGAPEPPGGEPPAEDAAGESGAKTGFPRLRVKYNKREHSVTPEEAVPLVEMGMKWNAFRPRYEQLREAAQARGSSVGELVDGLLAGLSAAPAPPAAEAAPAPPAAEAAPAPPAAEGAPASPAAEGAPASPAAEGAPASPAGEGADFAARLPREFRELAAELPGRFDSPDDLPLSVLREAADSGRSLLDAYLRHTLRDTRRAVRERERQTDAAARSAGPLRSPAPAHEPSLDLFEQAFRTALR